MINAGHNSSQGVLIETKKSLPETPPPIEAEKIIKKVVRHMERRFKAPCLMLSIGKK